MLAGQSWGDTCLLGDAVEVNLYVRVFEDGDEELGVGFACRSEKLVL